VDNRAEVREFLISRRAKVTPKQAGLPDIGARRVPGLRRGEVAALAGVSIEYYSKLERGALAGVSVSVLDAIARALQLDDAERAHLFHLAHAADGTSAGMRARRRPSNRWTPRPSLQWMLDRFTGPAIVRNGRIIWKGDDIDNVHGVWSVTNLDAAPAGRERSRREPRQPVRRGRRPAVPCRGRDRRRRAARHARLRRRRAHSQRRLDRARPLISRSRRSRQRSFAANPRATPGRAIIASYQRCTFG